MSDRKSEAGDRPYVSVAAKRGCPRTDLCVGMTCVAPSICHNPAVNIDPAEWKRRLDDLIPGQESEGTNLYEQYAALCSALSERKCESCDRPAQHVDPDGSTWCFECVEPYGVVEGAALYPGIANVAPTEEDVHLLAELVADFEGVCSYEGVVNPNCSTAYRKAVRLVGASKGGDPR